MATKSTRQRRRVNSSNLASRLTLPLGLMIVGTALFLAFRPEPPSPAASPSPKPAATSKASKTKATASPASTGAPSGVPIALVSPTPLSSAKGAVGHTATFAPLTPLTPADVGQPTLKVPATPRPATSPTPSPSATPPMAGNRPDSHIRAADFQAVSDVLSARGWRMEQDSKNPDTVRVILNMEGAAYIGPAQAAGLAADTRHNLKTPLATVLVLSPAERVLGKSGPAASPKK